MESRKAQLLAKDLNNASKKAYNKNTVLSRPKLAQCVSSNFIVYTDSFKMLIRGREDSLVLNTMSIFICTEKKRTSIS